LVGLAFFAGLLIYSFLRASKRTYVPSLLLINLGFVSSLVRKLFFFDLSPHPARAGGVWLLATVLILVWGYIQFLRVWLRERVRHRSGVLGSKPL
jgi:hypothetical protein